LSWDIGEDIIPTRPEKRVYEVFVGFDSEFVREDLWQPLTGDDLYHASITSRHVKGSRLFHTLTPEERRAIERRNKSKNAGYKNRTLSYQLSIFSPQLNLLQNEILLTDGVPVRLDEVVGRIAHHCGSATFIPDPYPIFRVFLIAHWSLAELQTFKDFNTIKSAFDSVRGTYITMAAPYEVNTLIDKETQTFVDIELILNDTMLLAPPGHQSLASLGRVIDFPKIEVDQGFKERMDLLLKQNPQLFYEYAIGDSVIALTYWIAIHAISQESIGPKLFQTVGALAIGYFTAYLKKAGITRKNFHGKDSSNFERYKSIAAQSFHGGRGESFCAGILTEPFYDVDLSGAYAIGMAHLPRLDHSKAFFTNDLNHLFRRCTCRWLHRG
jgi:hypothetical protein